MPEEVLHDPAFTLMCYYAFGVWTLVLITVGIGCLVTGHPARSGDPDTTDDRPRTTGHRRVSSAVRRPSSVVQ